MPKIKYFIVIILFSSGLNLLFAQLPAGFTNELVTDDLYRSLAFTFLPDGRIIILEKDGQIKIGGPIESVPITLTTFMTIPNIDPSGEHGLIQIALDPDFEKNGYFYLYYSATIVEEEISKNRVSRFQDLGDPVSRLNSEKMIWEATHPFSGCCHTGGALVFVEDGTMLLTTGDDFSNKTAQDLAHSNGKVHRINSDGSIPDDNPYYDTTPGLYNANGVLKSIYASGLRNPFRGKFDTQLNTLLFGEVGGNVQIRAWEDLHSIKLGEGGANFGWPACGDGSTGRESNGDCTDPKYTDPIFTYPHDSKGSAIIGGVFYRDFKYPNEFRNKYFYGDYTRNWIKYIDFDENLNPVSNTMFDNDPGLMIDFEVGPDGNLYYVRVLTAEAWNIGTGEIRRYVYGDPSNSAPECVEVSVSPDSGLTAPLSAVFNARVSDADDDTIKYTWDFGDGNKSTGEVPASGKLPTITHEYTTAGKKGARLYLTDQKASTACNVVPITVGQPPIAKIVSPLDNSFFRGMDTINFLGEASDPDGTLDSDNMQWFISFKNGETSHPRQGPDVGKTTSFKVPTNNHVPFVGDTGYIVTLVVTDSDGLTSSDSIFLQPEKSTVTLNSNPTGLTLLLDGVEKTTPFTFEELINFEFELKALDQCLNDKTYIFSSWSTSETKAHQIRIPDSNITYKASFNALDGCVICNKAIEFDGEEDEVMLSNDLVLSDDFTIEFWANLDYGINNSDQPLGNGSSDNINFYQTKARLFVEEKNQIVSNFTTKPNEWHHYSFVREGNMLKVLVDGLLDNTTTTTWSGDFNIAVLGTTLRQTGYLKGKLDEVRVWNIARRNSDITAFYNKSIEPNSTGLEAYWRFNSLDGTGEFLDLTGNGYTACLGATSEIESNDPMIIDSNLYIENDCLNDEALSIVNFSIRYDPYLMKPDPSQGKINFAFESVKERTIIVFDIKGSIIDKKTSKQDTFEFSSLNKGLYLIAIISGSSTMTETIVIKSN